jgi:hypothetical protein
MPKWGVPELQGYSHSAAMGESKTVDGEKDRMCVEGVGAYYKFQAQNSFDITDKALTCTATTRAWHHLNTMHYY